MFAKDTSKSGIVCIKKICLFSSEWSGHVRMEVESEKDASEAKGRDDVRIYRGEVDTATQ